MPGSPATPTSPSSWVGLAEVRRTIEFGFDLADEFGVRLLFNWYAQIPGSHLWADAQGAGVDP